MAMATTVVDVVTQADGLGTRFGPGSKLRPGREVGSGFAGRSPYSARSCGSATRALAPSELLHSSELSDLPFRTPPHCPNQLGGGGGGHLSALTLTLKGGQRREVRGLPSTPALRIFPEASHTLSTTPPKLASEQRVACRGHTCPHPR